jgi:hypothetical protein
MIEFLTVFARALIHRSAATLYFHTEWPQICVEFHVHVYACVYSNLITEYRCMAAEKVSSAARKQAERIVTIIVIKRALHSTLRHGKVHLWNNNCVHSACCRRRWKSPTVVTK